jgi:hypothetical protein
VPHAAVRFDVGTGAKLREWEGAAQVTKPNETSVGYLRAATCKDTVGAESVSVTVCTHQLQLQDHHRVGTLAHLESYMDRRPEPAGPLTYNGRTRRGGEKHDSTKQSRLGKPARVSTHV